MPKGKPLKTEEYAEITIDGKQVVIRASDLAKMVKLTDKTLRPFIEAIDLE
jgi:hypothetical protein